MKYFFLLITCTFFSFQSYAQTFSVSGTIVNQLTKESIAGLYLEVDDENLLLTDANGSFSLILKPGKHIVAFEINNKKSTIEFNLKEKDLDLKWIEIDVSTENSFKYKPKKD